MNDLNSGIIDCSDSRAYLTKSKLKDPDQPSFLEAMHSHDSDKWVEAMKREISELLVRNTWKRTHKKDILDENGRKYTVLKLIWVFKLKRLPDGTPDRLSYYILGHRYRPYIPEDSIAYNNY